MASMYGADIGQLRALAAQFDSAADQLDSHRATVGSCVATSPWQGPDASRFRYDWDATHAAQVAGAASTLRTGAQRLRANADAQEIASSVDGSLPGGAPGPGGMPGSGGSGGNGNAGDGGGGGGGGGEGSDPGDEGSWWDPVLGVWTNYRTAVAPLSLAASLAGLGFLATSVRGTSQLSSLASALAFSPGYQAINNLKNLANFGSKAGKVFGWAGVGLNAVGMVQEISDGDVGGAVWAGTKTALGVAALVAPPPANLVFGGISAGIAITEFAVENWDTISDVAGDVWDGAKDVVGAGADFVGDVGKGIGKVADKVWPW